MKTLIFAALTLLVVFGGALVPQASAYDRHCYYSHRRAYYYNDYDPYYYGGPVYYRSYHPVYYERPYYAYHRHYYSRPRIGLFFGF